VNDDEVEKMELCIEASMNPLMSAATMVNLTKKIIELEARNKQLEGLARVAYEIVFYSSDSFAPEWMKDYEKLLGKGWQVEVELKICIQKCFRKKPVIYFSRPFRYFQFGWLWLFIVIEWR
jgi:hypothetical protein